MMENIAPLHIFQIKKDLSKSMRPILRYSKNSKQLFWMVPKWLTIYLANYVINKWPTAFSPISNPLVFEVLYLVVSSIFFPWYKNWFKNVVHCHSAKVEEPTTTTTISMQIVFCQVTFACFSLKLSVIASNCTYLKSHLINLLKIWSLRFQQNVNWDFPCHMHCHLPNQVSTQFLFIMMIPL